MIKVVCGRVFSTFVEEGTDLHPTVVFSYRLHGILQQVVEHPPDEVFVRVSRYSIQMKRVSTTVHSPFCFSKIT